MHAYAYYYQPPHNPLMDGTLPSIKKLADDSIYLANNCLHILDKCKVNTKIFAETKNEYTKKIK